MLPPEILYAEGDTGGRKVSVFISENSKTHVQFGFVCIVVASVLCSFRIYSQYMGMHAMGFRMPTHIWSTHGEMLFRSSKIVNSPSKYPGIVGVTLDATIVRLVLYLKRCRGE